MKELFLVDKMVFGSSLLFGLHLLLLLFTATEVTADSCTHGKLYFTDENSTTLRVFDLDSDSLANMKEASSLDLPGGITRQYLYVVASSTFVVAVFWGDEENAYEGGQVTFINTGAVAHRRTRRMAYQESTIVNGTSIKCPQAYNIASHDGRTAIACDGSYDAVPPVNSTYYIIDETMLRSTPTESAIIANHTIQSSHHTFVVPINDEYIAHSLPSLDRIQRVNSTDPLFPLGNAVQVVDYEGNVIRRFNNITDPNNSCTNLHGVGIIDNTLLFPCDQNDTLHGGMLVVDLEEPAGSATMVKSHALFYPEMNPYLRVGDFSKSHSKNPFIVGDLSNWFEENVTQSFLVAVDTADARQVTVQDSNVLTVDGMICSYGFENSEGQVLLVWLSSGVVQFYSLNPMWTLLAEKEIIPGMTACEEAEMAIGYMQAFVTEYQSKTLYAINIHSVVAMESNRTETTTNVTSRRLDEISVDTTTLDFSPYHFVVAGVYPGSECTSNQNVTDYEESSDSGDQAGEDATKDSGTMTEGSSDSPGIFATSASGFWLSLVACVIIAISATQ